MQAEETRDDCWWHTHDTWNRSHNAWSRIGPYEIKSPKKRNLNLLPLKNPPLLFGRAPPRSNELPPKPQQQLLSGSGGTDSNMFKAVGGEGKVVGCPVGSSAVPSDMTVFKEINKSYHVMKNQLIDQRVTARKNV